MADLARMTLPQQSRTVTIDPPAECGVCQGDVSAADLVFSLRGTPGERHGNTIDLDITVTGLMLTAQPCGHVFHEQRDEADDDV